MLSRAMNNNAIILCSPFLFFFCNPSLHYYSCHRPLLGRHSVSDALFLLLFLLVSAAVHSPNMLCVCVSIYIFFVLPLIILVSGVVICNANFTFLLLAESWSVMPIGKESFCFMHQCVGTMYLILSWYTHDLIM